MDVSPSRVVRAPVVARLSVPLKTATTAALKKNSEAALFHKCSDSSGNDIHLTAPSLGLHRQTNVPDQRLGLHLGGSSDEGIAPLRSHRHRVARKAAGALSGARPSSRYLALGQADIHVNLSACFTLGDDGYRGHAAVRFQSYSRVDIDRKGRNSCREDLFIGRSNSKLAVGVFTPAGHSAIDEQCATVCAPG